MFDYCAEELLGRDMGKMLTERITSRDRCMLIRYFDLYLLNRTETMFESRVPTK